DAEQRLVAVRDAGIVDDDIEATKGFGRRAHHRIYIGLLRHVAGDRDHAATEAGGELAHALAVDVGRNDARALQYETLGDGAPEPRRGPRHDRDLVLELHDAALKDRDGAQGSARSRRAARPRRGRGSRRRCRAPSSRWRRTTAPSVRAAR